MQQVADLLAETENQDAVQSNRPMTFEELNQGYGYMLYRRHFNQPISGKLIIEGLRDYATVYVDGEYVGHLNRYNKNYSIDIEIPFNSNLEILVENMGRINYGSEIVHNNKGIIAPVKIDDNIIEGEWEMVKLPMSEVPSLEKMSAQSVYPVATADAVIKKPAIYKGTFTLDDTGDTFLNMEDWGKGIVFINGINIGRYWQVGPQQTLFVPGVWLKKGVNEIVIFEQLNEKIQTRISSVKKPILTQLKTDKL